MKIYHYFKLVVFIAFAVLVFVLREELLMNLQYLVGSLMLLYGLENVILISIKERTQARKSIWFIFGYSEVLLGLVTLIAIGNYVAVCVMWGVWSILRESLEIYEITSGEIKGIPAIISGIESAVAIVFSVLLIITPGEHHAKTHIYLLIVELIITSFIPVLKELLNRKRNE